MTEEQIASVIQQAARFFARCFAGSRPRGPAKSGHSRLKTSHSASKRCYRRSTEELPDEVKSLKLSGSTAGLK